MKIKQFKKSYSKRTINFRKNQGKMVQFHKNIIENNIRIKKSK